MKRERNASIPLRADDCVDGGTVARLHAWRGSSDHRNEPVQPGEVEHSDLSQAQELAECGRRRIRLNRGGPCESGAGRTGSAYDEGRAIETMCGK